MSYDVRAIANAVLDRAEELAVSVSNLTLNKILYFVHGHYFGVFNQPLIREEPEAWEHGPVYREIYRQFSKFGDKKISSRAQRIDFGSGEMINFVWEFSQKQKDFIWPVLDYYVRVPAWTLVEMSHKTGGPWDVVWNHKTLSNPGMLISHRIVAEHFQHLDKQRGEEYG